MAGWWKTWLSRSAQEANATSGLVTLLGGGTAAFGAFTAVPVAAIGGGVVILGAAAWCAWKGYPPKLKNAFDLVGATISARDVDLIDPPISKAGFLGASRVGKTTLLSHIAVRPNPNVRTDHISVTVISSQTSPQKYLALFDGAGQKFTQQFKILDSADVLLIFVDHNDGDNDVAIDETRMAMHLSFVDQLRDHITSNGIKVSHVHFVLNKSDLWMKSGDVDKIQHWFNKLVDDWNKSGIAPSTRAAHSNNDPSSITTLINELFRHVG